MSRLYNETKKAKKIESCKHSGYLCILMLSHAQRDDFLASIVHGVKKKNPTLQLENGNASFEQANRRTWTKHESRGVLANCIPSVTWRSSKAYPSTRILVASGRSSTTTRCPSSTRRPRPFVRWWSTAIRTSKSESDRLCPLIKSFSRGATLSLCAVLFL